MKKVINQNDYDIKVADGNKLRKEISKLTKSKTFNRAKTNIDIVKAFLKINPSESEDINSYIDIASKIKNNISGLKVDSKFNLKNEDYKVNNKEIENYTDKEFELSKKRGEEKKISDFEFKKSEGLIPEDMTYEQYQEIISPNDE